MSNEMVNREYKASLFAWIFSDREAALELYNSVNGTDYDDPSELRFNTIEKALYMGMKNDNSFLFAGDMNLYEHQSTYNPNMPLRGVFYFSALYWAYVKEQGLDLYSNARLKLPVPRYIVFYNGSKEMPESEELRLSDSFLKREEQAEGKERPYGEEPALECVVQVLNVNYGHNRKLMEGCRKLQEYAYLVNAIRRRLSEGKTLRAAVDEAVDECIEGNILKEFLLRNRVEVTDVILEEYDEELHIRSEKKLSYEEGRSEGYREGQSKGQNEGREYALVELVARKLRKGKPVEVIAEELETDISQVTRICEAAQSFAPEYDAGQIFAALQARTDK